jgi:flagellin-like hook-associated protein FlgL
MASDITLSSAIQSNLLALQNTASLQDTTQSHLSTGLKVSSAIDNPVAYFQAKALTDRASDFQNSKDNIGQGISSLSTALQGITSIQTLVSQLKGLALSAQSASSTQIGSLVQQYNALRGQINTLAQDTSYQGLNLIAGSGSNLTVSFSNLTGSNLVVSSVDASASTYGLNIAKALTSNGGFQVGFQGATSAHIVGYGNEVDVVYSGTANSLTSGTYTFSYGTQSLSIKVASQGGFSQGGLTTTANFTPGTVFSLMVGSTTSFNAGYVLTASIQNSSNVSFEVAANTAAMVSTATGLAPQNISFTLNGLTGTTLLSGTYTFSYGGNTVSFLVAASGAFDSTTTLYNGETLSFQLSVGSTVGGAFSGTFSGQNVAYVAAYASSTVVVCGSYMAGGTGNVVYATMSGTSGSAVSTIDGQTYMDTNLLGAVNAEVNRLDVNLQTLRAYASNLGTNVALLNTRLDFTNSYINLLSSGSGKLTLADLNQEGANLLALQTRQQLGVQALSFAGQNEKSILQLFR